jgi:5-methylcytosine-specific restriction endonuclease McrA
MEAGGPMSHGSDKRLSSWTWRAKVRPRILRRDGHRCHWRLPGCTDYATTVDHIRPRIEGGAVYDEGNLVASCASCNRRRQWDRNATTPLPVGPVFSEHADARGRLADFLPRTRWASKVIAFSRRPSDDAGR